MNPTIPRSNRNLILWLALSGIGGVILAFLYPDSYQQDAGHHYLQARWAWTHPSLFVGVWGRPLFVVAYALPALLGYTAAKIFTVGVCVAAAWQTAKLAEDLGFDRAPLAVPLLMLQPSFFMLSFDTLTEPLCALVLVVALRLHQARRVKSGMLVASLMALVAPWGVLLGFVWGVWVLADRELGPWWKRLPLTLILGSGVALWWLAALIITGDPAWIRTDWPKEWQSEGRYGTGAIWWYGRQMIVEVLGVLILPFAASFSSLGKQKGLWMPASLAGALFIVLTVMFRFGIFNAAGYARYLVCVAPVLALMALAGWNALASKVPARWGVPLAAAVILAAGVYSFAYVDRWPYGRDAFAVREMHDWFAANPRPVSRLGWSQAYMSILFDRDPWEKPMLVGDREANLEILRKSPSGTLIFWDGETGPAWHRLKPEDFESVGYQRLRSQSYELAGRVFSNPRRQEMHLLYKP